MEEAMSNTSGKKRRYMKRKRWERIWICISNTTGGLIFSTFVLYITAVHGLLICSSFISPKSVILTAKAQRQSGL